MRSAAALTAISVHPAFSAADVARKASFVLGFVAEPLSAQATTRVLEFRNEHDDFHVHGRAVYWLSRARQSESTFSNAEFERALKLDGSVIRYMITLHEHELGAPKLSDEEMALRRGRSDDDDDDEE